MLARRGIQACPLPALDTLDTHLLARHFWQSSRWYELLAGLWGQSQKLQRRTLSVR